MIRLSLFISLLLTSVAVPADVQINIRGNVYIPPCTINNGQNIVVDFSNVDPGKVSTDPLSTSQGKVTNMISISCPYNSGNPWVKVTGNVDNNSLTTNIKNLRIALYQGNNTSTRLTLGDGSGDGYRLTMGLNAAGTLFTFTSVLFRTGELNGGGFSATASMSIIYS
jgi:minor pilin subunit PapF